MTASEDRKEEQTSLQAVGYIRSYTEQVIVVIPLSIYMIGLGRSYAYFDVTSTLFAFCRLSPSLVIPDISTRQLYIPYGSLDHRYLEAERLPFYINLICYLIRTS